MEQIYENFALKIKIVLKTLNKTGEGNET